MSKKRIIMIVGGALILCAAGVGIAYNLLKTNDSSSEPDTDALPGIADLDFGNKSINSTLENGVNFIKGGGTYTLNGDIEGSICVLATDEDVKLILNSVSIKNSSGPAIYFKDVKNGYIELVGDNTIESTPTDDLNGAIHSQGDLKLSSDGKLTIKSDLDGIISKDDLEIAGGSYTISAADDGIIGRDSLKISGGKIDITAGDDALKTTNEEDAERGYMEITDGVISINAGGDGVNSINNALISGGELKIDASDDGIHSDATLTISGGKVTISKSYEALEGKDIVIEGGEVSANASDDGINVNGDGDQGMVFGNNVLEHSLYIKGGSVYVNSGGDGLDANGNIYISGGTTHIDGPLNDGNGALDYDGVMEISGGTLIAVGSSGMSMNASSASQPSVLINLGNNYSGKLEFGEISYSPSKQYSSVLISSPTLKTGNSYDLKVNGNTVTSVTVSNNITGSGSTMGPGGGMQPGGGGMGPDGRR